MAAQAERGVPVSTLCPKFLHSNSTSHTWPFSAIAELIDNAYDPDVSAKQFWIDKTVVYGQECLSFMDNGNGLNHETMHKMLSFGYSDKKAVKGISPIGVYGNGFKSGSMRVGLDAIVFSKSKNASCVGMLSQTYLKGIQAEQIQVPIISFKQTNSSEEQKASLEDILRFSPFKSESELLKEINIIGSSLFTGNTGTRIIIWSLRRMSNGKTELDFEKDRYDIRIPSDVYEAMNHRPQLQDSLNPHTPECVFSLRAYCSILYLKPRLQIVIRGQKVKSELIAKSLAFTQKDHYKPATENKKVPITFGYNTKRKDQYGVMMYHKNRLIKAYERVGCQIKANNKGVGVIGVIECNFLEPTHNKQSFMENDKYRKTMNSLGFKLEEYWNEIRHRKKSENPTNTTPLEDTLKRPDQNWVRCDFCMNWRKLPDGIDINKLPEKWSCNMNPDPQYRSCQVAQELEDSDDEQSYTKTYRKQEREEKKMQEKQHIIAQRHQQHLQSTSPMPSPPVTPQSRIRSDFSGVVSARTENSPQTPPTTSQSACSPSSSKSHPVITSYYSLSSKPRPKRMLDVGQTPETKRLKENGVDSKSLSLVVALDDNDNTDDDIFLMEESSPLVNKKDLGLKRVTEPCQKGPVLQLDCSDDATVDFNSTVVSKETFYQVYSTAAQTQVPRIKAEKKVTSAERKLQEDVIESLSRREVGTSCDRREFKVEERRPEEKQTLLNGFSHVNEKQPICLDPMEELNTQQAQLIELMTATAEERDQYKEELHRVTCQLQDLQDLQDSVKVKVEPSEALYEQPSTSHRTDSTGISVEQLARQLQQNTSEREELQAQVERLKEEKAGLVLKCEELESLLQLTCASSPKPSTSTESHPSNSFQSLVELRHNIGRLLVKHVPDLDLDLDQVNYECNVIDEILEQYLG